MDVVDQINKFKDFFEKYHYAELLENVRQGKQYLHVNFQNVSEFDIELASVLLDQPEEVVKAAELAVKEFDLPSPVDNFRVRLLNLPTSQMLKIRDVRSKHIGKFLMIEGLVRQKSDVRPQVTSAKFECPSCGNVLNVLQLDKQFKEPSKCGCGRKGKFRMLDKELIDAQGLKLEESSEALSGGEQPKRISIFLKNDLVSPLSDKKTNPGSKIRICGVLKEVPITTRSGAQSTMFDLLIEANSVEAIEEDFGEILIDKKDEEAIKELSEDPKIFERLSKSIVPSIFGHDRVKQALVLQLMGGVAKVRTDGVRTKGDMHVLLIGDPGCGKSQMLRRFNIVAPKSKYVSGKGASGAGLTASVVKDEFLQGWSLEAGALVLANKGFCCIDELDKMGKEDRSAMHEALEQQSVTISKANIQATLRCETTVLAAANPKFGRFDPYELLAKQIDLPSTLINRFDLIFPIRDMPDEATDDLLAQFILDSHKNCDVVQEKEKDEMLIETELLRKYVSYARKMCKPLLTTEAVVELKKYYVNLRNTGSDEGGIKAIPISARQLEGLIRLSESIAKSRLSSEVTAKDAKKAIELLHYCLSQIGVDPETGKIDIDRISSGITASTRNKISNVKECILELEGKIGKVIPMEDLVNTCEEKGMRKDEVEEIVEKLKRSGDLFSPRRNFISRI